MRREPVAVCLFVLSTSSLSDGTGFAARARALTRWVADTYQTPGSGGKMAVPQPAQGVPDPQKYLWPRVLARLSRDPKDSWSRAMIAQFWNKGGPPAPHAASFYHFAALGLTRIFFRFPDAVAPYRARILAQALREDQLFHGQGTENHIAMWRTSGYLFAQEAGDAAKTAEMKAWLTRYAKRLYEGGQGEFDSSTYLVFDIGSWLNLFDYARDPQVKAMARAVVDFYAGGLALKYTQGVEAGAEKRGYSLRSNEQIADFAGWLWWDDSAKPLNDSFFNGSAIHSMILALSAYRPAPEIVALAHKARWRGPEEYRGSKPNYAMDTPSQTRETLYITPRCTVGVSYSPIGGWGGGDTQETLWKFAARGDERSGTAYVVGGAGASFAVRSKYAGEGRGPWDQVAQNKDIVLQMTRVPENAEELTARAKTLFDQWRHSGRSEKISWADPVSEPWAYLHFPARAPTVEKSGILFIGCGDAYVAALPLGGAYTWVTDGVRDGLKVARTNGKRGQVAGFAYEFGSRDADGSFEAFQAKVLARSALDTSRLARNIVSYTDRTGQALKAEFVTAGAYFEPEYDWGPQPAWPTGEGHGRVPRVWVGGKRLDLTSRWPVYQGPRLHLDKAVLRVTDGHNHYQVAFDRDTPHFSKGQGK